MIFLRLCTSNNMLNFSISNDSDVSYHHFLYCHFRMATPVGENNSYELQSTEAISYMKQMLPDYVVQCFIASGFDTLSVISHMNISMDPGNSIQEIEKFINDECADDPRYARGITVGNRFRFPPGHRHAIEAFVRKVKELQENKNKPEKQQIKRFKRFAKPTTSSNSSDSPLQRLPNQANFLAEIRRQITKWQRSQKEPKTLSLKEHEHFIINISVKKENTLCKIYCQMCGKHYTLGRKEGKSIISNWTRHLGKCIHSNGNYSHSLCQYLSPVQSSELVKSPQLARMDDDSCESDLIGQLHPQTMMEKEGSASPLLEDSCNEESHTVSSVDNSSSCNKVLFQDPNIAQNNVIETKNQIFRLPPP